MRWPKFARCARWDAAHSVRAAPRSNSQSPGLLAFLLELPVPGAGYFYIGEHKQGLALMGLTVTAVGTAF